MSGNIGQLVKSLSFFGATIDSELIVRSQGRKPFSFLEVGKDWLKQSLEVLAKRMLVTTPRQRCDWDAQHPESERKKERKDMVEISPELDWHGTTTLLRGEKLEGKFVRDLPEMGNPLTERQKGILRTIQEGSIKTGHRLIHGTLDSPYCYRCSKMATEVIETPRHVFWECADGPIREIRNKFLPAINKILNAMGLLYVDGLDQGLDLMEHAPFLNCGLIPEDARLIQADKDLVGFQGAMVLPFDSSDHREKEWWIESKRVAFGDGSCSNPKDYRLARAGAGVYFGPDHPANLSTPVPGDSHTSYSAELWAALQAVEVTDTALHYTCDNKAVAEQAEKLVNIDLNQKPDFTHWKCGWMWNRVWDIICTRPRGYFTFSWQKGHVKERHPELVEQGVYSQKEADWNDEADKLAEQAAEKEGIPL